MFDEAPLVAAYRRLELIADAQARGSQLEGLVKSLFSRGHFRVERNAGAAAPRQTDLTATNGTDNYLIEVKWQRTPVDVGDVDNVRIRLLDTASSMVGVLISVSGFTRTAIARVREKRDRPILLMTGAELTSALEQPAGLANLLRDKFEELLVHGQVLLDSRPRRLSVGNMGQDADGMPLAAASFHIAGQRRPLLACGGSFGQFVFVQDIPDIDWVPGSGAGVSVDLSCQAESQEALLACLSRLGEAGWLTSQGRWNIQQATRNWHGIGPTSLAEAIAGWVDRYHDLEQIHHTEQLCYQDTCEGGFFTLTVDIAASEPRRVWHCDLSLQLSGVPLDSTPIRQLAALLQVSHPLYFRPRNDRAVTRHGLQRDAIAVDPVGFVVVDDDTDPRTREWVCGIVVANPFELSQYSSRTQQPEWLPGHVDNSELLICALRQWHPHSYAVAGYRLTSCEWTWTSDAMVFRGTADWDIKESDDESQAQSEDR